MEMALSNARRRTADSGQRTADSGQAQPPGESQWYVLFNLSRDSSFNRSLMVGGDGLKQRTERLQARAGLQKLMEKRNGSQENEG